jgi:hypothetical protein
MAKIVGFGSSDGGCGCSKPIPALGLAPDGLGLSPDGLGGVPPLAQSPTGNSFFDALLGAGLGAAFAETKKQRLAYAAAGALAVGLAGTVGIVGAVGLKLFTSRNKG